MVTLTIQARDRVNAAKESLFPPTWLDALRELKKLKTQDGSWRDVAPSDLLFHLTAMDQDAFVEWFRYRSDFPSLLTLWQRLHSLGVFLNLASPDDPDFADALAVAKRCLAAATDCALSQIALDESWEPAP